MPGTGRTHASESSRTDAAGWFKGLVGEDYPVPGAIATLAAVKQDVWASHVTPHSKVVGFPQFMSVSPGPEPPESLRVLGYGGHGLNRYAIYATLTDASNDIRLRLAFGGAFMDMPERRQAVLADLALFEWLHARTASLAVHAMVRFGMGDREIRLTSPGEAPRKVYECFHSRLTFRHDEVRKDIERALAEP